MSHKALLAAIALLTACLNSAITPVLVGLLATAPPTGIAATAPSATPPRAAAPEGAATATPASADWYVFTNYGGGFRVDVPGVIGSSHGYFINDFSGQGADFSYAGAPISTPLQQLEAQTDVSIRYSTKITTLNICPQGGTPVQIGSGGAQIPAWEGDGGPDIVAVNLVLNGAAIEITLTTRDASQPVLPRYATIWRHMLASFAALPGQPHRTTHPCG